VRFDALGGGPNTLGWYGALGVLGSMTIFGETRSSALRIALVAGGLVSVYAIMASASRGGFIALAIVIVLWPLMCLRVKIRRKPLWILTIAVIGLGVYYFVAEVYQDSNMSQRWSTTSEREQREGGRQNITLVALTVFLDNPVVGVGFGQFPYVSGLRAYTHTEIMELLVSTGLVGTVLYLRIYFLAWRRLTASLKAIGDESTRYKINCARMALIMVVLSGVFFKPHLLVIESHFLIAMIVGMGHWAEAEVRRVRRATARKRTAGVNRFPAGLGGRAVGAPQVTR